MKQKYKEIKSYLFILQHMRQNAADLTRIYSLLKDRIPLKLKKCYVKNTTSKFSTLYSPPPSPPPRPPTFISRGPHTRMKQINLLM